MYRHLAELKRKIDDFLEEANVLWPDLQAHFEWGPGTSSPVTGGHLTLLEGHPATRLVHLHLRDCAEWYEERCRQERLTAVWGTMVDAVVTIDEWGNIQDVNPGCEQLLGYEASELRGQNVACLMPEPFRSEHDGYLARFMSTGHARIIGIGRRVPAMRKDGQIFPAHLSVSQQWINGKRHFTGVLRDISDVVEARTRASLEERKLLSRELHDSVSQALFGVVLGTQAALNALDQPEQAREAMRYVLSLAESGLAEMRALIFELRPESIEGEGLLMGLRRQGQALAGRYQLLANFNFPEDEPNLPVNVKHEAYRFVMEALHNVVKHARATTFTVIIEKMPHGIRLEVSDDGIGFDPSQVGEGHVGLESMRERVSGLGGTLLIKSEPGQGTSLEAALMQGDWEKN